MVFRAALICIVLISVQVHAFRTKTVKREQPTCRSLKSHTPSSWCQENCVVPGKTQVELPACLASSGVDHQVCDCEDKAAEPAQKSGAGSGGAEVSAQQDEPSAKPTCRSLRSHIPSPWCQANCIVPGKSQVEHPACLASSGVYHQVCDCEGKAAEPAKPAQEDGEDGDGGSCRAHEKCRHLDGDCCPDSAGLMLDCCAASDPKWTPEMWGKGHGQKHEMKGRVEKTKEQGGTRESPSDQLEWFAAALDMIDDHRKAQEIIRSVKNKMDAEDKAKDAMKEYTKDDAKLHEASTREKKAVLAAILREVLENIKDEDQGAAEAVGEEVDPKKAHSMRHKQKHVELKQGKDEFLKFFEPSSEKAKGALKDDIEVIEPADDASGTIVDLGKKSIYCSMEDGEVCSIFDEQNYETIRIEKQDWEFRVTRNGTVHDCGSHNTVDTTCGWDTPFGTRYLDFGSALLSADDVKTIDTTSTDAPNKSSSKQMQLHLATLSLLVAAYAFLM